VDIEIDTNTYGGKTMFNLELFDRAQCTREEKSPALTSALAVLHMAERARREGILSLEEDIEDLDSAFAKALLRMVVDSTDAEIVRAFGEATIASSGWSGKELLAAMVTLEGVLMIDQGANPHVAEVMLSAYFGMDADMLTNSAALRADAHSPAESSVEERRLRYASEESIVADIRDSLRLSGEQTDFLRTAAPAVNPFEGMQADTAAIALLYLDEADRKKVFETMPPEKQSAVVRTICELSDFDAGSFVDLARKSLQKIIETAESNFKPAGGVAVAASMLRNVSADVERSVLQSLEREAPELATGIRQKLFVFEDVILLDDNSIQKLMCDIDTQDLVVALKGTSPAIQEKFFKNVSSRAAQALREDMEFMGPVTISRVKEAREKIIAFIRIMEERGDIIINRRDDEIIA
jgi:flagellar motor switch protein FliG